MAAGGAAVVAAGGGATAVAAVAEVAAAGGAAEVAAGSDAEAPLPPTPGFVVRSESWVPSAIGPLGLAGQEPRGLRGLL